MKGVYQEGITTLDKQHLLLMLQKMNKVCVKWLRKRQQKGEKKDERTQPSFALLPGACAFLLD